MKAALLVLTAGLAALSLIAAPFPDLQALMHDPTVAALLFLAVAARKQWLPTASFAAIVAFLWLHILGEESSSRNFPAA